MDPSRGDAAQGHGHARALSPQANVMPTRRDKHGGPGPSPGSSTGPSPGSSWAHLAPPSLSPNWIPTALRPAAESQQPMGGTQAHNVRPASASVAQTSSHEERGGLAGGQRPASASLKRPTSAINRPSSASSVTWDRPPVEGDDGFYPELYEATVQEDDEDDDWEGMGGRGGHMAGRMRPTSAPLVREDEGRSMRMRPGYESFPPFSLVRETTTAQHKTSQ